MSDGLIKSEAKPVRTAAWHTKYLPSFADPVAGRLTVEMAEKRKRTYE